MSFAQLVGSSTIAAGLLLAGFLLIFAIVSLTEEESRAARRAFLLALLLPIPYLAVGAVGSAQQYLNSGAIHVQIAEFIRNLGYSARAHIDGSYRVVCPLVARDAGLGEIGRTGLLMTPKLVLPSSVYWLLTTA